MRIPYLFILFILLSQSVHAVSLADLMESNLTPSAARGDAIPPTASIASLVRLVDDNNSHWTHDNEPIGRHLPTDHGLPTTGLTQEEMLTLHDWIHEGKATDYQSALIYQSALRSSRPISATRTTTSTTVSSCPDGNCPGSSNTISYRFPLLNKLFR